MKTLVGHGDDPEQLSQIVVSKNPGARHSVQATEQYAAVFDDGVFLTGAPFALPLEQAAERAPVPDKPEFNLVALYIGAELIRLAKS